MNLNLFLHVLAAGLGFTQGISAWGSSVHVEDGCYIYTTRAGRRSRFNTWQELDSYLWEA